MSTITLAQAKAHLRDDNQNDDDDALILVLIDATEAYIAKQLGEDMPDTLESPLQAAALLMIGDLYNNRELQGTDTYYQNKTFTRLLHVYRSMNVEVSA